MLGLYATAGCQVVMGWEETQVADGGYDVEGVDGSGGSAGAQLDAGEDRDASGNADSACGCGPLETCWEGQCIAKSVQMPEGFFIDVTEVTRAQYASWLATQPSTLGLPGPCAWKTNHEPGCPGPLGATKDRPVECVDWCDAYAYCRWAGKRLCGKIGGGSNAYPDYKDPGRSQWYAACSAGGTNKYPYGDTYEETTCNGSGSGVGHTVDVGSLPGCQSSVPGYEGVFDLSGNLWEWEDSCFLKNGNDDNCRIRGGSFTLTQLACDFSNYQQRDLNYANITIRCCWD